MRHSVTVAYLVSCLFQITQGFSVITPNTLSNTRLYSAVAEEVQTDFYDAVQLASKSTSKIDIDEFERLATSLESVDGCNFEEGPELCEKEIQDRLDVAQILRLRIELQLRYVERQGYIFIHDVVYGTWFFLNLSGFLCSSFIIIRLDYLENANLFAQDVRKEHDQEERRKFKQELIANREKAVEGQSGSDLGLW